MLLVQKYHSIHEIDPEFITNIETLLQEEVPGFNVLIDRHDKAPDTDVFTFFLFFAPTQNTPIGFAQICLRKIHGENFVPWWKKLCFFCSKDYKQWKEIIWKVSDGNCGLSVFDPKFSRSGKEKIQEILLEYEKRTDIKAQQLFCLKGFHELKSSWTDPPTWNKETFVLEPLAKAYKTYEDYLAGLAPDVQSHIMKNWKELHQAGKIEMGDYPKPSEAPHTIPVPEETLTLWEASGAQLLTFEKDLKILGCLVMQTGRNGNVFFEPFPFEPEGEAIVSDELYTQYALLKFFETPEARKCHLLKFGSKLVFENKNDLTFFLEQGFQMKTVTQSFQSKLPALTQPL
jgi:hypothetical protein